jgi:hypothetical protein
MTDLKKIRIQTHKGKNCEPRLVSPDFTSISRFEQPNSPSGFLTTRCPAVRCLNSQTLLLNSLCSVLPRRLNITTGYKVQDCRALRVYSKYRWKDASLGVSLRPYIGHANDRHINPGLYGVFTLPQQSTLHVQTDPLLGQQIEFLVFRIKTQ